MADREWAGTTYGNGWMLRHLIVMLRYVDVRILYLFSAVFVVPVCLVLNRSRKTAYWYFRRRMVRKINVGLTEQEKEFLVKAFEKINIYFKESLERIE